MHLFGPPCPLAESSYISGESKKQRFGCLWVTCIPRAKHILLGMWSRGSFLKSGWGWKGGLSPPAPHPLTQQHSELVIWAKKKRLNKKKINRCDACTERLWLGDLGGHVLSHISPEGFSLGPPVATSSPVPADGLEVFLPVNMGRFGSLDLGSRKPFHLQLSSSVCCKYWRLSASLQCSSQEMFQTNFPL